MADQGRWFKLWVTADDDPDLSNLSLEDFARWCLFGLWLKKHGTDGSVSLCAPCTGLLHKFRVSHWTDVLEIIAKFPNIVIATAEIRWPHGHERPPETDGEILCGSWYADGRGSLPSKYAVEKHDFSVSPVTTVFVTWRNWAKYQGDFSTDRVRKFREMKRSKKRRDEKRRDEKNINPPSKNPPLASGSSGNGAEDWPAEWRPIADRVTTLPFLAKYRTWLEDLAWWKTMDELFTSCPKTLDGLLLEAVAYCESEGYVPRSRAGIRKKLKNCMEFSARKADREAQERKQRARSTP